MDEWRKASINGIKQGDSFTFTRKFTQEDVEDFGRLTRDYNPVHYDDEFAAIKGFEGLICHGLLVGAMVCEIGGQVAWLASGMKFSFLRPVYIGDTITCTLTVSSLNEKGFAKANAVMVNQQGVETMRCTLQGYLPGEKEKIRLSEMIDEKDPTNTIRDKR